MGIDRALGSQGTVGGSSARHPRTLRSFYPHGTEIISLFLELWFSVLFCKGREAPPLSLGVSEQKWGGAEGSRLSQPGTGEGQIALPT